MTDKEAMKLALEALELLTGAWQTFDALDYGGNAIAALKERLAQPEQNFCSRCGKRTNDIHTCTPPKENT